MPDLRTQTSHGKKRDNLISISGRRKSIKTNLGIKPKAVISQQQLAEERLLAHNAAQAARLLERRRKELKKAISNGATVEPGDYTAEMVKRYRKPTAATEYFCLVVR